MIPVEEGKTSTGFTLNFRANSEHTVWEARMPGCPVAQLAFPAFTMTALTRPREARKLLFPTATGAAASRFRVNMAAAEAPSGISARARSGLPLALIPAVRAENENPAGSRRVK